MRKSIALFGLIIIISMPLMAQRAVSLLSNENKKHLIAVGTTTFDKAEYQNSLIDYIDTIIAHKIDTNNVYIRYKAVFNNGDTLYYRERQKVIEYSSIDYNTNQRIRLLEVESLNPPYERSSIKIDGLTYSEIASLKDSMLYIPASGSNKYSTEQTCVFYALEAIFKNSNINPDPIINRNTNFIDISELNKFVDYFFRLDTSYTFRWKEIKDVKYPNNSLLVIKDAYDRFIHAVYYNDGLFYSKNGVAIPVVYSSIKPVIDNYSRWGVRKQELSKEGKLMFGNKIDIYMINTDLFQTRIISE